MRKRESVAGLYDRSWEIQELGEPEGVGRTAVDGTLRRNTPCCFGSTGLNFEIVASMAGLGRAFFVYPALTSTPSDPKPGSLHPGFRTDGGIREH